MTDRQHAAQLNILQQGLDLQAASIGKKLPALETDEDRRRNHLRQMASGIACVNREHDEMLDDPRHGLCKNGRFDE